MAVSDDGQVCHIYERFQDSAAVMTHLQLFDANFATRFMEIFKPTRIVIDGPKRGGEGCVRRVQPRLYGTACRL